MIYECVQLGRYFVKCMFNTPRFASLSYFTKFLLWLQISNTFSFSLPAIDLPSYSTKEKVPIRREPPHTIYKPTRTKPAFL
jgi:hypothetical protein